MQRNQWMVSGLMSVLALALTSVATAKTLYGHQLCKQADYKCQRIKSGQSWESLFPDAEARDIVKRVNRMNMRLRPGLRIAVPKHLEDMTIFDVSPFPRYIEAPGERLIVISQEKLAFGAYDGDGELLWWGPVSTGKNWCRDTQASCVTPGGEFRIIRKQGIECISSAFPRRPWGENGGAPMPYCMHFYRGYAIHGSTTVPGKRDSHGCVRMFTEDARWLNLEFIQITKGKQKGTRVMIEDLD